MMNILLVSPKRELAKGQPFPPLGLLSIASVLRLHNHSVEILDRDVDATPFSSIMLRFKPEVVGFSTYTGYMLNDAIKLSQNVKQHSNAIVIWGGVHPTLLPNLCLKETYIDITILGEGEYVMPKIIDNLINNKPLNQIDGIGFKDNGTIIINPQKKFIDLHELPLPAWDLIKVKKYYQHWAGANKLLRIYSSKGCPNQCGFCYNQAYHKSTWRGKSCEQLIEEIKYLKHNYKINGIGFTDDLFTFDKERMNQFCNILLKEQININWYCNARIGLTHHELDNMKKAGCKCIYFGIESGSSKMLKIIRKGIVLSKVQETFEYCRKIGISTVASFIIGFPDENEIDLQETISFALGLKASIYDFSIYKCYPGTRFYQNIIEKGIFKEPKDMKEWINISSWDNATANFSNIPSSDLKVVCNFFVIQSIINSLLNDVNTLLGYVHFFKIIKVIKNVIGIAINLILSKATLKKYNLKIELKKNIV